MKKLMFAAATSLLFSHAVLADSTIYYPNEKEAVFTVTAPDDTWEFAASTNPEEDGGYCTLTKGDTVLYFRTVEASKDGIETAITETYDYVASEYPGVELPEAKEMKIEGKDALAASGEAKDKDGNAYKFGFAWIFIDDKSIAEIWYESSTDDEDLHNTAAAILDSFKVADGSDDAE